MTNPRIISRAALNVFVCKNLNLLICTLMQYLTEAIGMMLATEMMVPGRLEEQIKGWRRIGFADGNMRYYLKKQGD